eukprot:COSAG06_NODE_1950_length_7997_cov_37.784882_1_plen_50_part_10
MQAEQAVASRTDSRVATQPNLMLSLFFLHFPFYTCRHHVAGRGRHAFAPH